MLRKMVRVKLEVTAFITDIQFQLINWHHNSHKTWLNMPVFVMFSLWRNVFIQINAPSMLRACLIAIIERTEKKRFSYHQQTLCVFGCIQQPLVGFLPEFA